MKSNNFPLRNDNTKLLYNGQSKSAMLRQKDELRLIGNPTNTMDLNNYLLNCNYKLIHYTNICEQMN